MIESVLLKSLTSNEDFARKVVPFLTKEYFLDKAHQTVYLIADQYFKKYNQVASLDVLEVEIDKLRDVNENLYTQIATFVDQLAGIEVGGTVDWLVGETEAFCQDRALHIAMQQAVQIMQGNEKKLSKTAIPDILREALSVSFDTRLGHDYQLDAEAQFDYYTAPETKIPFDIEVMNDITNGGVTRKTLNLFIGGTHAGKTLAMCHFAAAHYQAGYNVLYITMEEAEEKIRYRIDANLLNSWMDDVPKMQREVYLNRVAQVKKSTIGNLKIKEYPTGGASVANFRFLLNELKIKENFVPDIIYVDYLNICSSDRFAKADSLYTYNKAIAEELRGFAKEADVALFTATQLNREGFKDSDPDMGDVSDSFGVPMTADMALILIGSEELDRLNQLIVKQQKNRYKDLNFKKRFIVGCLKGKMRWYDLDEDSVTLPDIDNDKDDTVPKPVAGRRKGPTASSPKAGAFADFE